MRIWSLHPQYLDSKGIVALWRETLLAKHVLEGKTKGYKNHPQLNRFKAAALPLDCIHQYLYYIYEEAKKRGYQFNKEKFQSNFSISTLTVTNKQIDFEFHHLLNKLRDRDEVLYKKISSTKNIKPHPLFKVVKGNIADWEIE